MIPYGRQSISEQDIDSVVAVLRSQYLTQGPVVPKFEAEFSAYVGAKYGVAVNSATSGLHIACMALGVGDGDLVWTSPISFVASANCAVYCRARVDFVDIDPVSFNMCPIKLQEKLEVAKRTGSLPKVVIPVHLAGQSCDMEKIHALATEYGFRIIEDASHATGGKFLSGHVGNCKYSDIAVFSFHPVKIITSGEGGMAVTNDHSLSVKMASLRSHGITRDPEKMTIRPDGAWFYQQLELGFNYRMTDIHAALGLSQLNSLDSFIAKRHDVAAIYDQALPGYVELPKQCPKAFSSYHLYIIRVLDEEGPYSRADVFNRLRASGVNVNLHYIPIYRHPFYASMGFCPKDFPNSEQYYQQAISIPIYPDLTIDQQVFIAEAISAKRPLTYKVPDGFQDLF